MAIGDLVSISLDDPTRWVVRLEPQTGARVAVADIATERVFMAPPSRNAAAGADGLVGWLGRLWRRTGKLRTLVNIADDFHDIRMYGTTYGVEAIAVPYPHLAILTGSPDSVLRHAAETGLREKLRQKWQDYVDPLVEVRVRIYSDDRRSDGALCLFFGRGIFVPERGEKPIGRVDLIKVDAKGNPVPGALPVSPTFPDGQAVGLYRGQSACAFAAGRNLCPATCSLIHDDGRIYLLDWSADRMASDPALKFITPEGEHAMGVVLTPTPIAAPAGYDEAYVVERDGEPDSVVRVAWDLRPSRLRYAVPGDVTVYFEITGILAPDEDESGLLIERWWVDLDAGGRLIGSALAPVARSIVCQGSNIESYNWQTHLFTGVRGSEFVLDTVRLRGRQRRMLRAAGKHCLGLLRPPESNAAVTFAPGAEGEHLYALDWLDFSGALETPSAEVRRLGEDANKVQGGIPEMRMPGRSDFALNGHQVLSPAGTGGAETTRVYDFRNKPGAEFVVGPLVLRVTLPAGHHAED